MSAIVISDRVHVDADQATVWDILTTYSNDVAWRTGVTSMVSNPPGRVVIGTRTTETIRVAGRTYRNVAKITSVAPLTRLTWRTIEGVQAHGARSVEPTSSGSRVTLELTVEPTGLNRLFAPYLRRLLRRNMRVDLQRLCDLVDERTARTSGERETHLQPAHRRP
jgi:uncharacterized membrane protein